MKENSRMAVVRVEKKIVIAGCRDFNDYNKAKDFIESCLEKISSEHEIIILSGGCRGADLLGERYAKEKGYSVEKHPANWGKYGKSAGVKRNEEMAKNCDVVICFWDQKSRGTRNMISVAQKYEREIFVKNI